MKMNRGYSDFLKSKIVTAPVSGFDISPQDIHPALKPHQRDAVLWSLRGGRRALFESFGLGKTVQELEFCRQIVNRFGGKSLIVMPLGVRQEFTNDAVNILGMDKPRYVRTMDEARAANESILLTNYERVRDGDIDPKGFVATCLDEAAVLRSFGSKTYQTFLDKFRGVKYKLVATATPAPNRYKELIHYAGYLEIMDTGQALTRFFKRDSTKANNLTLYPHKEQEFWLWVSSFALFISLPSDLGYDDTGYALPPMEVRTHVIARGYGKAIDRDGQYKLLNDAAASLSEAAREKRESIDLRITKAKEIIDQDPAAHFLVWHDLEAERHEIKRLIPGTTDIYGSMDYEERERRVIDFSFGKVRIFATKKSLSGCGCNFQRYCHRAVFVGVDYEFHDFIQAVHRIYRFLQTEKVIIDIIYTEAEEPVYRALTDKWKAHIHQQEKMREIVKKYGLSGITHLESMSRSIGVKRVEIKGRLFTAVNNDCVEEVRRMTGDSVGLIHTSIPFGNHYEYTPSYNDFGHTKDTEEFFEQMDFLTPELLRILKPGRVAAIHVKDRVLFGNATGTGMPTMEPFHMLTTMHYMRHGFKYMGMITVVTDVVRENNQTYRLGWSEQCKDGSKMGVGCPEYILLFRKLPSDTSTAYADEPVKKEKTEYTRAQWQIDAHGYWRSSGNRLITKEELLSTPIDRLQAIYRKYNRETVYDYAEHIALAKKLDTNGHLPATFMVVAPGSWTPDVWDDINRMKTLNTTQSMRQKEMHVCPLQIEIVERIINRYSNPGDTVLDPFGGLGTVALCAMKAERYGYTIELNNAYFRDAVGYLKAEEEQKEQITMFDLLSNELRYAT
jgi:DNA modification methylase